MIKNVVLAIICLFTLTALAEEKDKSKTKEQITFSVPIDCQSCVDKINQNMSFEKGVKAIECSIAKQMVVITYRPDKTNEENLREGFAKIGYKDVKVISPDKCMQKNKVEHKCCGGSHSHN